MTAYNDIRALKNNGHIEALIILTKAPMFASLTKFPPLRREDSLWAPEINVYNLKKDGGKISFQTTGNSWELAGTLLTIKDTCLKIPPKLMHFFFYAIPGNMAEVGEAYLDHILLSDSFMMVEGKEYDDISIIAYKAENCPYSSRGDKEDLICIERIGEVEQELQRVFKNIKKRDYGISRTNEKPLEIIEGGLVDTVIMHRTGEYKLRISDEDETRAIKFIEKIVNER